MGNCQAAEAAEAAEVVIHHPCGRIERHYTSLSASHVMSSNPGHYVAVIIISRPPSISNSSAAATKNAGGAAPVKHMKLLRPDDTLHIGHLYRLVSFEQVLREFASKKHVRLSRLLVACKEKSECRSIRDAGENPAAISADSSPPVTAAEEGGETTPPVRPGQWRPALQSIAEDAGN